MSGSVADAEDLTQETFIRAANNRHDTVVSEHPNTRAASFGRFVLKKAFRGKGIADLMAKESINQIIANFGNVPIKIEAQAYLKKFYEKQGY